MAHPIDQKAGPKARVGEDHNEGLREADSRQEAESFGSIDDAIQAVIDKAFQVDADSKFAALAVRIQAGELGEDT